jgi:hypothetical protein
MSPIMIPPLFMGIPSHFGPASTLGGASRAHTSPSVLALALVRSLDLAGAGLRGALIGVTGACCTEGIRTHFRATHFMIATPTSTGTIEGSLLTDVETVAPEVSARQRAGEPWEHVPALSGESAAAEKRGVIPHAAVVVLAGAGSAEGLVEGRGAVGSGEALGVAEAGADLINGIRGIVTDVGSCWNGDDNDTGETQF